MGNAIQRQPNYAAAGAGKLSLGDTTTRDVMEESKDQMEPSQRETAYALQGPEVPDPVCTASTRASFEPKDAVVPRHQVYHLREPDL
jgi:hypothetical protein